MGIGPEWSLRIIGSHMTKKCKLSRSLRQYLTLQFNLVIPMMTLELCPDHLVLLCCLLELMRMVLNCITWILAVHIYNLMPRLLEVVARVLNNPCRKHITRV